MILLEQLNQDTKLQLNLLINYGGRQEITRAVQEIIRNNTNIQPSDINEDLIEQHLYTYPAPDPDMIVRSSGEKRISNFLLWQLSYSELFFIPELWPDITREHFIQTIKDFQTRKRRFGKSK